jgi:hypothetical protein
MYIYFEMFVKVLYYYVQSVAEYAGIIIRIYRRLHNLQAGL